MHAIPPRRPGFDSRSVADPDPGSGAFLTTGSGMGNKSGSGFGIRDEQPGNYFLELRNHFFRLKYLNFLMRIREGKKFGSGMEKRRIREPGKHPGSAILDSRQGHIILGTSGLGWR